LKLNKRQILYIKKNFNDLLQRYTLKNIGFWIENCFSFAEVVRSEVYGLQDNALFFSKFKMNKTVGSLSEITFRKQFILLVINQWVVVIIFIQYVRAILRCKNNGRKQGTNC